MTIYFYKVCEPYGCFSNFSPHPIKIQGVYWATVEHYYQSQRFVDTEDNVIIPLIRSAPTPEMAAALGRCETRKSRPDWNLIKIDVMKTAVRQKFLSHKEIQEVLLGTGDETLVENSPIDYFWGCGADKTGENHLGKILMAIRNQIRFGLWSN